MKHININIPMHERLTLEGRVDKGVIIIDISGV